MIIPKRSSISILYLHPQWAVALTPPPPKKKNFIDPLFRVNKKLLGQSREGNMNREANQFCCRLIWVLPFSPVSWHRTNCFPLPCTFSSLTVICTPLYSPGGGGGRGQQIIQKRPSLVFSLFCCSMDKLVGISQQMCFSALHTIFIRRNIVHIYLRNNSFYKHCEV